MTTENPTNAADEVNAAGEAANALAAWLLSEATTATATLPTEPTALTATEPRQESTPKKSIKKKKQKQTIKFLFIRDPELSLQDRVLYSYFCRLQRLTDDGKKPKRSMIRLKRYTGYRRATILKSIRTLTERGYIDANQKPLKKFSGRLVRRDGDDHKMIYDIVKINVDRGRVIRPGWVTKTFGISRATAYRVCPQLLGWRGGTVETKRWNR